MKIKPKGSFLGLEVNKDTEYRSLGIAETEEVFKMLNESLAKLGDTSRDIANSLAVLGIEGKPRSHRDCPLANYLNIYLAPTLYFPNHGFRCQSQTIYLARTSLDYKLDSKYSAFISDFDFNEEFYHDINEQRPRI